MGFNPDIHHRRSIRLRGYDYSQPGWYFVTICTHQRACLFGEVSGGRMVLNAAGEIAHEEWTRIAGMRAGISLDRFVIMPNHMHGIIQVGAHCMRPDCMRPDDGMAGGSAGEIGRVQRAPTVGDIIRGYKSSVTRRIWELCNTTGTPVWQRNYYEHIIRNEQSAASIRVYIDGNAAGWEADSLHPGSARPLC